MPDSLSNRRPDTALASRWFKARNWRVFRFQRETWQAILNERSGLVHASTGSGKTYAVWLGALMRAAARESGVGLRVLCIKSRFRDLEFDGHTSV